MHRSMDDTEKRSEAQGERWCDRAAATMGCIFLLILFAFGATAGACRRGATLVVYKWMLSLLKRILKTRWSKETKRFFVLYLMLFQSIESVVADIAAAAAAAAATPPPPSAMERVAADGTYGLKLRKLSDGE